MTNQQLSKKDLSASLPTKTWPLAVTFAITSRYLLSPSFFARPTLWYGTVVNCVQERDSILQDIYEMSFKNHWMKPPPEFKVTKVDYPPRLPSSILPSSPSFPRALLFHPPSPLIYLLSQVNQAGKHQERVFRLTIDSLLNLHNSQIKSETSFAGIEGRERWKDGEEERERGRWM